MCGQRFPRNGMSVSYCQRIDVNVKKLTQASLASLRALDNPQQTLTKCDAFQLPT
jgi:hypothetical protein